MCGIVGYTGHVQAAPILLDGLARLEYRGYDSAGLAVRDGTKPAEVVKATGKLYHLADKAERVALQVYGCLTGSLEDQGICTPLQLEQSVARPVMGLGRKLRCVEDESHHIG